MNALQGLARSPAEGGQFLSGLLRGMHGEDSQGRREARQLRLPVAQQGGREHQDRRRVVEALGPQGEQQGQHLDRLAQPHVVGEAGPQSQAGHQAQPVVARLLVGAQDAAQTAGALAGGLPGRLAQVGQDAREPAAGHHLRPLVHGIGRRRHLRIEVPRGPRQQAHALCEAQAAAGGRRLHPVPLRQGLGQPLAVDLHPPALQPDQAVPGGRQPAPFGLRQPVAAQGQAHVEVEHGIGAEGARPLVAHGHADPRPGPCVPPVGQAHDQTRLLEDGHVPEQLVGLGRGPGQGLEELPGIHQPPDPLAVLGSGVHGRQQAHEGVLVAGAGILLQRAAEGLVLDAAGLRQPRRVGGQEGERVVLVALVLGQVETDPPDLVPAGGVLAQPGAETRAGQLAPHPGVEVAPQRRERAGVEVFGARHRGSPGGQGGQLPGRRFELRARRIALRGAAQPGEVEGGEVAPEGEGRPQRDLRPAGGQRQEAGGRAGAEGLGHARRPRVGPVGVPLAHEEVAGGGQDEFERVAGAGHGGRQYSPPGLPPTPPLPRSRARCRRPRSSGLGGSGRRRRPCPAACRGGSPESSPAEKKQLGQTDTLCPLGGYLDHGVESICSGS